MLIPVRCFTCGKVIGGDIFRQYQSAITSNIHEVERTTDHKDPQTCPSGVPFGVKENAEDDNQNTEYKVLNKLGIRRYCCRRMLLAHVEMIDHI
jgi:DNA-directed RNA polymerase subunit N